MKNLSTFSWEILLDNTFQWLEKEYRADAIESALTNKEFVSGLIEDLYHDAELSMQDFPEHATNYRKVASELEQKLK